MPAQASIGAYSTYYTAAARYAIGANTHWFDGVIGSVPSGGNVLSVGPDPTGVSPSTTQTVTKGTTANLIATSQGNVTPSGVPAIYDYAGGGPLLRMPDNSLVLVLHTERWPGGNPALYWAGFGLAKSTNEGAAWSWLGEIITPADAYNVSATHAEDTWGGPMVKMGGYYYIWFGEYPSGYSTAGTGHYDSVARCSAASFESAVAAGSVPVFAKYDGTAWTQAGLGGLGAAMPGWLHFEFFDVWFAPWLGCLVCFGRKYVPSNTYVWYTMSRDGIHWTAPVAITDSSEAVTDPNGIRYPSLMPAAFGPVTRTLAGNMAHCLYLLGATWSSSNPEVRKRTLTFHTGSRRTGGARYRGGPNAAFMR